MRPLASIQCENACNSSCARHYIFIDHINTTERQLASEYSKVLHSHRIISTVGQVSSTCTLTGHLCFLDGLLCFLAPPPLHEQVHTKESGSVEGNDNLQRQEGNVTITMTSMLFVTISQGEVKVQRLDLNCEASDIASCSQSLFSF